MGPRRGPGGPVNSLPGQSCRLRPPSPARPSGPTHQAGSQPGLAGSTGRAFPPADRAPTLPHLWVQESIPNRQPRSPPVLEPHQPLVSGSDPGLLVGHPPWPVGHGRWWHGRGVTGAKSKTRGAGVADTRALGMESCLPPAPACPGPAMPSPGTAGDKGQGLCPLHRQAPPPGPVQPWTPQAGKGGLAGARGPAPLCSPCPGEGRLPPALPGSVPAAAPRARDRLAGPDVVGASWFGWLVVAWILASFFVLFSVL